MKKRVGVRQYLVLGALSQMPSLMMYQTDLAKHVNRVAPGTPMLSVLANLEAAGLVHRYGSVRAIRLTELGAGMLCERRRAETTVFARVADSIMAAYTS